MKTEILIIDFYLLSNVAASLNFVRISACNGEAGCAVDRPSSSESFSNHDQYQGGCLGSVYCAHLCYQNDSCLAFSYWSDENSCQFYDYIPFKISYLPFCESFDRENWNYKLENGDELYHDTGNVALGKRTCQSSTSVLSTGARESWLAVDGILGINPANAECSHTDDSSYGDNWFMVDLTRQYLTKFVRILCRSSDQITDRYVGMTVGVTNSSWKNQAPSRGQYPLCGILTSTPSAGQWTTVNCSTQTPSAKFVILQSALGSGGYLSICELEVFVK